MNLSVSDLLINGGTTHTYQNWVLSGIIVHVDETLLIMKIIKEKLRVLQYCMIN